MWPFGDLKSAVYMSRQFRISRDKIVSTTHCWQFMDIITLLRFCTFHINPAKTPSMFSIFTDFEKIKKRERGSPGVKTLHFNGFRKPCPCNTRGSVTSRKEYSRNLQFYKFWCLKQLLICAWKLVWVYWFGLNALLCLNPLLFGWICKLLEQESKIYILCWLTGWGWSAD